MLGGSGIGPVPRRGPSILRLVVASVILTICCLLPTTTGSTSAAAAGTGAKRPSGGRRIARDFLLGGRGEDVTGIAVYRGEDPLVAKATDTDETGKKNESKEPTATRNDDHGGTPDDGGKVPDLKSTNEFEEEEAAESPSKECSDDAGGSGDDQGSGDGDGEDSDRDFIENQAPKATVRPTPPLFSFPPGPRLAKTRAEEKIQEILPTQQRMVKYLTDDRVFGVQVLCSVYFLLASVMYNFTKGAAGLGVVKYQSALLAVMIKNWGTVLGRMQRVVVPQLLYQPHSSGKIRARVKALALDPAVQCLVYCAIFLALPLGQALIPLVLREVVYLMMVVKEMLQLAAPGVVSNFGTFLELPLSVVMTAGDRTLWRDMAEGDRRLLLGRRLAQVCFKLEMWMPAAIALRVLPSVFYPLWAGQQQEPGDGESDGAVTAGGVRTLLMRGWPLAKVIFLVWSYAQLLIVKNTQLEDDVRLLKGLKIRGVECEWVEQVLDSLLFGRMLGCPWWTGFAAFLFVLISPASETGREILQSEHKFKTLGMKLLNLAIGRKPGVEDEDEDEDEDEASSNGANDSGGEPEGRLAKMAKVAAVASGLKD